MDDEKEDERYVFRPGLFVAVPLSTASGLIASAVTSRWFPPVEFGSRPLLLAALIAMFVPALVIGRLLQLSSVPKFLLASMAFVFPLYVLFVYAVLRGN